jgi:hypothetical protein
LTGLELLESRNLLDGTITRVLPEFNGQLFDTSDSYPRPAAVVGTFDFASELNSGGVKSATVSGTFGNSAVPNTSGVNLYLDGALIAQAIPFTLPYFSSSPVPWSYTLSDSELALLQDGKAQLTAVQTSQFVIRLGQTRLSIETEEHCHPGDVFSNVGLPAVSLDIAVVKSTGLQLAFDPLGLNFTVLNPGPGVMCVAQSNVGTLVASIRNSATGETHAVGYSTAQATLALDDAGNVHWHTDGFEVRAGSVLGAPLPIPLGTWGPYDFDVNVATLGLTTDSDFETIVRSAEPYIHEQLSRQIFEPFTQVLVMEDPGQTDLLVTAPSGKQVGKTDTGAILQDVPGSAYFASVPLVAVVAPGGGTYQTQVRGTGSGSYTIVTALVHGQSVQASQTFTGPIMAGLTAVYTTTLDPAAGTVQTRFEVGQSLDFFATLPGRLLDEGKIDNAGIANSLRAKLSNARARLAAGDMEAAQGLLNAFRNEVRAQQGKHITAAAAADLLEYDSYLLTLLA